LSTGIRIADGQDAHTATVLLRDARGRAVTGAADSIRLTADAGVTVGEVAETETPGEYEAALRSTRAGAAAVRAEAAFWDGSALVDGEVPGSGASVRFGAGAADADTSEFTVSPEGPVLADGEAAYLAEIVLRDAFGNPVPDGAVSLDADPRLLLSPGPHRTDASGILRVPLRSETVGVFPLAARSGEVTLGAEHALRFVAGEPSLGPEGRSRLTVSPGVRVADGADRHLLRAEVRDASGHPLPGVPVDFAAAAPASLGADTAVTGPDGIAETWLVITRAGDTEVTARLGDEPLRGSPALATFVPGPPALGEDGPSVLTVSPGERAADGVAAHTATALIRDRHGNPVAGAPIDLALTGGAVTAAPQALSDAEGRVVFAITSERAGTAEVRASLGGEPLSGSPAEISFVPGLPSTGTGGDSTLAVTEGARTADGVTEHRARAEIRDRFGNPVPNAAVDFGVGEPGRLTEHSVRTNARGIAETGIVSERTAAVPVRASVGGEPLAGSPATVAFAAGTADAGASAVAWTPDGPVTADGEAAYTGLITVRDALGNPVPGVEITLDTDPRLLRVPGPYLSDEAGTVRLVLSSATPGSFDTAVALGGERIGELTPFAFVPGEPSVGAEGASRFTVSAGTRVADGAEAHTLRATVTDRLGNPVPDIPVTFDAAEPGHLAEHTVRTDAEGRAETALVSERAAELAVSARVGSEPLAGSPGTAAFVAGPADPTRSTLTATPELAEANGVHRVLVTVTLRDALGNPVPDARPEAVRTTLGLLGVLLPGTTPGELEAWLTSAVPGSATVSLTLDGAVEGPQTEVRFAPTPAAPILDPSRGSAVTGTAEPGQLITITDAAGTVLGSGRSDAAGAFTIELRPAAADGAELAATAEDEHGFRSPPTTVRVD
ncbi:Ig-like domain-containing protein, partial [Leucobacter sp. M11]|uniref:Ig-like domain-containing protein n=1 Tax=Leucobacter sp. M11 TaxID=2993565 RepID=UPI002D7EB522